MNGESPDCGQVWEALRSILDPEFGLNIVDLGLIYSVECSAKEIRVVMTLTTPSCPAGSWIQQGVIQAVKSLAGAGRVEVSLVFDPVWTPAMLSEAGRLFLGA